MTTAARNALPRSSASSRRASGGGGIAASLKIDRCHFNWYLYIDGCRSEVDADDQAPGRGAQLRAGRVSRRGSRAGGPAGGGGEGARRSGTLATRGRAA